MKKQKDSLTYETAYTELQEIVNTLQNNDISIDDLSEKVKRAGELIAFCQNKLRNTELEVDSANSRV